MNKTIHIVRDSRLVFTLKPGNGTYSIGRDPGSDIVLADSAVSKQHALLIIDNDRVTIKDNNSANGVFLKGKKINDHTFNSGFEFEIKPFIVRSEDSDPNNIQNAPRNLTGKMSRLRITNINASVFVLVVLVMLCTLLIGYLPLKQQVGAIHRREVLKNGIVLSRYLAEINRSAIVEGKLDRTRISPVEQENGVIYAFVVDLHGRIIAPQEKQGDFFNWKKLTPALQGGRLFIDDGPRNEKIIFYPVAQGNRTLGAAIVGFAHDRLAETTTPGFGIVGYLLLAVLFVISMGIAHLLVKAFLEPLRQLHEEMEMAIKQDRSRLDFIAPYPEINDIKRTFERMLMRKAASSEMKSSINSASSPVRAGNTDTSAIRPDTSPKPLVPIKSLEDQLSGVSVPWCIIDRENYTLRRFSDHFTQTFGSDGCTVGMHVIEAFDTDMIQVISQIIDTDENKEIAMDHPDGKHMLRRIFDPADPDHIAVIFEEKA